jgi:hypothetical protein
MHDIEHTIVSSLPLFHFPPFFFYHPTSSNAHAHIITSTNYQTNPNNTNMTVTAANILTVETVPKYLEDHWDEITKGIGGSCDSLSLEGVQVKAIQGGNVNYAFCITLQDGKTIFLKQVGKTKTKKTTKRKRNTSAIGIKYKKLSGMLPFTHLSIVPPNIPSLSIQR